jgi:HSP20 family protein
MSTVADPLGTLRPLREEDVHELTREHEGHGSMPLAYDVYRDGQELVIEFDAPGVAPGDIALAVEGRTVDVSLGRSLARGRGIDVIEAGRQHGTFRQRLWLGDRWDTDRLSARAENGVLTVRAPLAARAPRRAVPVAARPSLEQATTSQYDEPAAPSHSDEDEVHSAA